ncbi:MAG: hypothetical protein EPN92_08060 [Chitinophagaceae bacterium]|nr:MAG: hypothetical protein EPN92_08060 [Chitinophagaceae bacterium]
MIQEEKTRQENFKVVYEQIHNSIRYFLDWRHKLFVGYIVIISALYYFIITWLSQQEHYDPFIYKLSCGVGSGLSILFFFLNLRNNQVIWRYQNNGYMYEKRLGMIDIDSDNPLHGLFGAMIEKRIKQQVDSKKTPRIKMQLKDALQLFRLTHVGIMNWFFILGVISFIILFFLRK